MLITAKVILVMINIVAIIAVILVKISPVPLGVMPSLPPPIPKAPPSAL